MGQFSKWLLHEDQKELFDYLFANVLNIVFLAVTALVLWPMGQAMTSWRLAKGYWVFCILLIWTAIILSLFQRIFRLDMDSHYDIYVITGLLVSGVLQVGWSAFAALTIHMSFATATVWIDVVLFIVGLFSSYAACALVSAFYMGSIYRMVNLVLALLSYIVFILWPTGARALYGWFFDLF
jgi:hypothetical protein